MLHKQKEKCHLVLGKLVTPGKLLRHMTEYITSPLVFPHGAFDCFPVPFLGWTRSADPIVVLFLHSFLLNTYFYIGTRSTPLLMYQHTGTGKFSLSPNHPHYLPEGKLCVLADEQKDAVSCCCLDSRAMASLHKL